MLHTDAIEDGARMPGRYTDLNPPSGVSAALSWSNVPPGTHSFVLLMHDTEEAAELADGTQQVSMHANGYRGPGPNVGANHHYVFELFALDIKLDVPAGVAADAAQTRRSVFDAMDGHVIGKASLVGRSALIPEQ